MNSNKARSIAIAIVLIVLAVLVFFMISNRSKDSETTLLQDDSSLMNRPHPLNASYTVGGSEVTLVDGENEAQIPNSSSTIVTSVWGEPIKTTREGESQDFWAVILNQITNESGSFYYISSCVGGGSSCTGTNATPLGDRISVQTVEIETDGTIVVNYTDRPANAPVTEQPSVSVTRRFTVIDNVLKEVFGG